MSEVRVVLMRAAELQGGRCAMRLFQVTEDDLCELEKILPQICDLATMRPDALPVHKKQVRVLQRILRDVRWNYGPPDEVEIVDA